MKVMKFGGTSVGRPKRMHQVAELVVGQSEPVLLVLSALSGTTNALVEIGNHLLTGRRDAATYCIAQLEAHYHQFVEELVQSKEILEQGRQIIQEHFELLSVICRISYSEALSKDILAQGELLSTKLFCLYLQERGIKHQFLLALDFMRIDAHDEPQIEAIRDRLMPLLDQQKDCKLFVTQGYICRNAKGEVDNLKRGGSDYTASLLAAAVPATVCEIWTDIDGMHNNDPRIVDQTRPVEQLSFEEAAELAYFGAKILHPASIWPAQQAHVPVKLLNTMQPDAQGTLIADEARGVGVKAVAAKDNIWAIRIKSSRMLLAYGFLRRVFEVYEKYRTPIDMVTTSEVAVSLTIDSDQYLTEILEELRQFGSVEVDADQTIVSVVGQGIAKENGVLQQLFKAIGDIPVRMVSHGGSPHNISLLVAADRKKELLQQLNRGLFGL
jgi:aspartate kinase